MRNGGCQDGKTEGKVEPTEVVEGDRHVRENQNLEVSCTDFVHAWSTSWNEQHYDTTIVL